jgi:hypothetical protein
MRASNQAKRCYVKGPYGDGGDAPDKPLDLVPGAIEDARNLLAKHPETMARFARVVKLVEGFESPFGMELLAIVHWVATREHVRGEDATVRAVQAWAPQKRRFNARQIGLAAQWLSDGGWIPEPASAGSTMN